MFIDTYKTTEIMLSNKEVEALETAIEVLKNIQLGVFFGNEEVMQSEQNKLVFEDFEHALDTLKLIKEESRWYLEE